MKLSRFNKGDNVFFIIENSKKGNKKEIISGTILEEKHVWDHIDYDIQTKNKIVTIDENKLFSFPPSEIVDFENKLKKDTISSHIAMLQSFKKYIKKDFENLKGLIHSNIFPYTCSGIFIKNFFVGTQKYEYYELKFSYSEVQTDNMKIHLKNCIKQCMESHRELLFILSEDIKEMKGQARYYEEFPQISSEDIKKIKEQDQYNEEFPEVTPSDMPLQ